MAVHSKKSIFIPRQLDLAKQLKRKSIFLLGPRQTGKSTLVQNALPGVKVYNLLKNDVFLNLSRQPSLIRQELTPKDQWIVIDEIQKLPLLLDEVQLMIEQNRIHFLLTGSSARKLRRGGTNLLGGRAPIRTLHPFIFRELPNFDLLRALNFGLLPSIYFSSEPQEDLETYLGTYLREEIVAEGATRNVPAFSRFLEVAATCHGQIINYASISNDAQVAATTVQEYFQILRDTLIGYALPAWLQTVKRKPISTSKFYFFDTGVARALQHRSPMKEKSPEFGDAFESYIFHELKTYSDYNDRWPMAYWRSTSKMEVDFIFADQTAIEVKGKQVISEKDLKGLRALQEEKKLKTYLLVSLVSSPRTMDGIRVLPWKVFLEELWDGKFN